MGVGFVARSAGAGVLGCAAGVYDVGMTSRASASRSIVRRPALLGAVSVLCLLGMSACQRTALRPDDNRSQFDRYDQSRSQRAQPFLEDEFGRRTPNLKARLLVSEE